MMGGGGGDAGTSGTDRDGGGRPDVGTCVPPEKLKELGLACGCHDECDSGSCVDGVCCSGKCDGTCQACNVPGKMGTCSPIPAGMSPVVVGQCKRDDVATCGFDGTCDGNGACRRYPDGTTCDKGVCDGATIKNSKACKAGKCETGSNTVCSPFACNADNVQCFTECQADNQCAPGQQCKNGSCGKKNLGAKCDTAAQCESGFCADGVCCNTSCDGSCVSCNQLSKMGECTPVAKDQLDPHKVCKDNGASACGTSGACDGNGGCAKYGPTTVCRPGRCEGANQIRPSNCDGKGSCVAANQVACLPYACSGIACNNSCTTDAQCSGGNVCKNNVCGPRGKGQDCTANSQCGSGFCVDGVCCESACTGQCKFCATPQAPGSCVNVAASTPDPRAAAGVTDPSRVCVAQDRTSCGRNGMCNGNGGCQLWDTQTVCENQSCSTGTNTASFAKKCDGFGMCKTTGSQTCAPYKCNGTACSNACGSDSECVAPNTCIAGKCGPKPPGALCNNDTECGSKFCRQGVCCQTDCKGSCFSCSLSASRGLCTAVPAGSKDPANVCKDDGVASCDRDGTCDGTGKCRLYGAGQVCAGATCVSGTATATSTCDGVGNCNKGSTRSCGNFKCNAEGTACYESCVDNNQCITGRVCQGSSCGLKPNGALCPSGLGSECMSGQCSQGYCCNMKCDGICKSCALPGNPGPGTCLNIPKGSPDLAARCVAAAPATCGNDGTCDGAGACAKFANTVTCRDQSCPADSNTQTNSAKCDGAGNCPAVQTTSCQLIKCDPQTKSCLTGCSSDVQCVSNSFCDIATMSCGGLKDNGTACTAGTQCKSGKCIEGVCCGGLSASANSCPACQSCAVAGKAGTCQALPAGPAGAGSCPVGDGVCGQQTCNGAGACVAANPAGTSCGTPSCVGEDKVQAQACNSGGACANAGAPTVCPGSFKCVAGACKTSCTLDTDCVSGKVCSGNQCVDPKKANGIACSAGDECVSGFCAGTGNTKVCCNSACTGACNSCTLTGTVGTCTPVAAGTTDTNCSATATNNLCTYGVCGANGACATVNCSATSSCSADGNGVQGATCNGTMTCAASATVTPCPGGFKCAAGACRTACADDTQCQSGFYCSGTACVAKKATADTCMMNNECMTGNCAQGVCCATACTGSCKTCAGANKGTCENVAADGVDPAGMCTDEVSLCGTNGKCNGSGGCQFRPTTTSCGSACSSDLMSTVAKVCNGAGSCVDGASTPCVGFLCAVTDGNASCSATLPPPPPAPASLLNP